MIDETNALKVLADLGAIPTAPLHEQAVASYVARFLRDLGVPFRVDRYGNLIATYQRGSGAQPIALAAHLDHPGFEVAEAGPGSSARATLLGGVPPACFDRSVPSLVKSGSETISATIVGYDVNPLTGRVASLKLVCDGPVRVGDFGFFDLPDFQREGDEIAMRAADDLAGVAALLLALKEAADSGLDGAVFGVFSRAEEIGLVGAALISQEGSLPPETIVISLECSRELPGAESGLGPVIRVGDRTRSFHPEGEALLLVARDRLSAVPVQRQLMSGGTCEATAFGTVGYRTTGIALPLINYHNVGADNRIVSERINRRDFLGEVELLVAAIQVANSKTPLAIQTTLQQRVDQFRDRLQASAGEFQKL